MQLSNNTLLQICGYGIIKTIMMLIVLTLSTMSLRAQNTIAKPEKKQQTTTNTITTQQKPRTNTTATNPTTGTINGHEWVDLGLSVKWATCNVGASSPSGYGNYYAWGETSPKSEYTKENSKTYGKSIGSIAGNSQYDAARANWGSTWRLPTASEIYELVYRCAWMWTTQGGHNGYRVKGPNGNSIFVPATGWRGGTSLDHAEEYGHYWSATPDEDNVVRTYVLGFNEGFFDGEWSFRPFGGSVRPVSD